MGLKEQQAALAKLYTSNSLREQLANSALRQEASLGLSQAEQLKLKSIVKGDVTAFALSLLRKRLAQVKKILPGALFWQKTYRICSKPLQLTNPRPVLRDI